MMTETEFRRQYQGEFPQYDTHLINLWCLYFYLCERYDQGVCSLSRDGEAIPGNAHEMHLVNKNASVIRHRIRIVGGGGFDSSYKPIVEGFTFDEWRRGACALGPDIFNFVSGAIACHNALAISYDPVRVGNW